MTSGRYIMSVFTVFFTSAASFFLPHSKLRSAPGVLRAFTCAPPKGVYNMYIYIYISTSGQILFHEQKWSSNEKKKKKGRKNKKKLCRRRKRGKNWKLQLHGFTFHLIHRVFWALSNRKQCGNYIFIASSGALAHCLFLLPL